MSTTQPADVAPGARIAPQESSVARSKRLWQHGQAMTRRQLVEEYSRLIASGLTPNQAAARMRLVREDVSRTTLDRWLLKFEAHGPDGLLSKYENCGRRPETAADDRDRKVVAANFLRTNWTAERGSTPESVRIALRRGELSPAFAAEVSAREAAGLPMVSRRQARKLAAAPAVVRQHRNPTEADLKYVSGAGCMRMVTDRETGERRMAQAGDVWESDDGTINLGVVIPWAWGGCPTSERYKVKLGRFQLLPMIDVGTSQILGYTYTCRQHSSYRGEDVLALMRTMFRQHGMPRTLRFERGIWECQAICDAMERLGIERWTAYSPHQKLIENLFNTLWTKLSDLPGQVGRTQGEMEDGSALYQRCRTGAADPRRHFPMLADVVSALDTIIPEKNRTRLVSAQYGEWIPADRWERQQAEGRLRPMPEGSDFIFAPCRRQLTARGNQVKARVAVTDDWSVEFVFAAPELASFDGCKVIAYFDPFGPDPQATLVLDQAVRDRTKGEVLCTATQIGEPAMEARRVMGWGADIDHGQEVSRATRQSLVRATKAILADGRAGLSVAEQRDGLGGATRIEAGDPADCGVAQPRGKPGPMPEGGALGTAAPGNAQSSARFRSADLPAPDQPEVYEEKRLRRARLAEARRRQEEQVLSQ